MDNLLPTAIGGESSKLWGVSAMLSGIGYSLSISGT